MDGNVLKSKIIEVGENYLHIDFAELARNHKVNKMSGHDRRT
jgi:hypothetical protein